MCAKKARAADEISVPVAMLNDILQQLLYANLLIENQNGTPHINHPCSDITYQEYTTMYGDLQDFTCRFSDAKNCVCCVLSIRKNLGKDVATIMCQTEGANSAIFPFPPKPNGNCSGCFDGNFPCFQRRGRRLPELTSVSSTEASCQSWVC